MYFSAQKEKSIFPELSVISIHCEVSRFSIKIKAGVLCVKPSPLRSTGQDSRCRQVNATAELEPWYHTIYDLTQKAQKSVSYLGLRLKSCKDEHLNCFEILKTETQQLSYFQIYLFSFAYGKLTFNREDARENEQKDRTCSRWQQNT